MSVLEKLDEIKAAGEAGKILAGDLGNTTHVKIENIKIMDEFKNIFVTEDPDFKHLELSMENNGYDENWPIILWEKDTDGDKTLVLIDGHRRTTAARNIGIETVPAIVLDYGFFSGDEKEQTQRAMAYIRSIQYSRRNLPEGVKFSDFIALYLNDKTLATLPAPNENQTRVRDRVAAYFGISPATAGRWLKVAKQGSEWHLDIINGKCTVHEVHTRLDKKKEKPNVKENVEATGDIEATENNPDDPDNFSLIREGEEDTKDVQTAGNVQGIRDVEDSRNIEAAGDDFETVGEIEEAYLRMEPLIRTIGKKFFEQTIEEANTDEEFDVQYLGPDSTWKCQISFTKVDGDPTEQKESTGD